MQSVLDIVPVNAATARHHAMIARHLRAENQIIGTNDLWIAAALANAMPLVTSNASHFSRVPGLIVVGY